MEGDNVGADKVTKYYRDTLEAYDKSDLAEGTCDSVDWADETTYWNQTYDGVKSTIWK